MVGERSVVVSIPSDLYAELGNVPTFHGNIMQKIRLDLAIGMYVCKEISLSRAAAFSGMSLRDFIELLNSLRVPVVDYLDEMLADDLDFAEAHR